MTGPFDGSSGLPRHAYQHLPGSLHVRVESGRVVGWAVPIQQRALGVLGKWGRRFPARFYPYDRVPPEINLPVWWPPFGRAPGA